MEQDRRSRMSDLWHGGSDHRSTYRAGLVLNLSELTSVRTECNVIELGKFGRKSMGGCRGARSLSGTGPQLDAQRFPPQGFGIFGGFSRRSG
jgi:hypothetical protein